MGGRILVLGPRSGALRAAERLGLEILALADRREPGELASAALRVAVGDLGAPREQVLGAARALWGERPPDAVWALSERAVLPAAWIRAELGLPGTDVATAQRCTDKVAMKRALRAADVPCAEWLPLAVVAGADAAERARRIVAALGLPLVVKLARSSGSRGQHVARTEAEAARLLGRGEIAERFVEGREMSVEVLVREGRVVFENPTEYLVRLHASLVPAELPAGTWAAVRALVERAVAAVGLARGLAHVELFLTADGPLVGEIAARPPGGRLMTLLERAWGFDPWAALCALELGREPPPLPRAPRRVAGAWILHYGPGKVAAIEGLAAARAVPLVRRVALRATVGDLVPPRAGSGQDVGWLEAVGDSRDAVAAALAAAHATLRVRMRPVEADGETTA